MNVLDTLNLTMKINHGVTQLLDDITCLGGEAGMTATKLLGKLEKDLEEKEHKTLIQAVKNCIVLETKGDYIRMASIVPRPKKKKKFKPIRIMGDPPPVVVSSYNKPLYNNSSLWINFGSTMKGDSKKKYITIATYRSMMNGSVSIEINNQGWCDSLPEPYSSRCIKKNNSSYFALDSKFAIEKFRGPTLVIDGLVMARISIRGGGNTHKKKGK